MMTTVEFELPDELSESQARQYLYTLAASRTATERVAAEMSRQQAVIGPATAAQLAAVEGLWRHLIEQYGVYTAEEIARMRGGDPKNRSIAANLAKEYGLIGLSRSRRKVYPAFEFVAGGQPHPRWREVSGPLLDAGWDGQDVLLWMVSPSSGLGGREPAACLADEQDTEALMALVVQEASGIW